MKKLGLLISFLGLCFLPNLLFAASTIVYKGTTASTTDLTTYSFTSFAVGTADANRYVIVGINASSDDGGKRLVNSCSIGGVTGLVSAQAQAATNGENTAFCTANVPSGTTATISVVWDGTMDGMDIVVWTDIGLFSATPVATASVTSQDPKLPILMPLASDIFAISQTDTNTPPIATWIELTEDLDAGDFKTNNISAAHGWNGVELRAPYVGVVWAGSDVRTTLSAISLSFAASGGGGGGCTAYSCLTGTENVVVTSDGTRFAMVFLALFFTLGISVLLSFYVTRKLL